MISEDVILEGNYTSNVYANSFLSLNTDCSEYTEHNKVAEKDL